MRVDSAQRKLDRLVNKSRSAYRTQLVNRVLALNESASDKALRIVMIDLLPETQLPEHEITTAVQSPPEAANHGLRTELPEEQFGQSALSHRTRKEPGLLAPLPVTGFWAYFFVEVHKIRRFGRETQTLVSGLFPFSLRLSDTAKDFQQNVLPKLVVPALEQPLQVIRARGWKFLPKLLYNLLVGVSVLVEEIRQIEPIDYVRDPRYVWDRVVNSAAPFYTTPEVASQSLLAWDRAAEELSFGSDVCRLGAAALKILLGSQVTPLSLSAFLEVVQMLKFRRALGWNDLLVSRSSPTFSTTAFDCSPRVQVEIDRYLEELSDELDRRRDGLNEIRRIRFYTSTTALLNEFIQGFESSEPVVWTRILLGGPLRALESLLIGNIRLASGRLVVLFDDSNVRIPLQRLRTIHQQLLDPTEQNKPELVRVTVLVLTSLAWRLADELDPAVDFGSIGPHPSHPASNSLYGLEFVDEPAEFAGMNTLDALVQATRFLFRSAIKLGADLIVATDEEERALSHQWADLLAEYVRIAPPSLGRAKAREFGVSGREAT